MALVESVIVFLVALVVGAVGIYVAGRQLTDIEDLAYASIAGLLGAILWTVASALAGGVAMVGPALALPVWVTLAKFRYPGGWQNAALVGVAAWILAVLVAVGLGASGVVSPEAFGVPAV